MSYITSFMDGEKYGADDINKIVSRFVHSGVEDAFVDGKPYNVRRLNDLSKPVTTRGVIGSESSALALGRSGSEYYISPGTAFFGNGSTLEVIENEIISLEDTSQVNYVYLVSSEEENRNYIEVSTVEPDAANENIVLLAEISPDGKITDRRCYATGKLRGMYQDNEFTMKKTRIQETLVFPVTSGSEIAEINKVHDLGCSKINLMAFTAWNTVDSNGDFVSNYYRDEEIVSVPNRDSHSVMFWLPSEDKYYGIIASDNKYLNSNYYIINNHQAFGFLFEARRSGGKVQPDLMVQISHLNGNLWNFKYVFCPYGYWMSSPLTINFDYKLYYI